MAFAANNDDLDALASAWREFHSYTPAALRVIENARHFRDRVAFIYKLRDKIGDRQIRSLKGLRQSISRRLPLQGTISRTTLQGVAHLSAGKLCDLIV